jgi:hypothetical protein
MQVPAPIVKMRQMDLIIITSLNPTLSPPHGTVDRGGDFGLARYERTASHQTAATANTSGID